MYMHNSMLHVNYGLREVITYRHHWPLHTVLFRIYTLCRHQLLSLHLHPSTAPAATSHLRYVIIKSSLVEIEPLAWVPYGLLTYTYQICQLDKRLNTYCYFLFDRIASMQWSTKRNNCYPAWQTKLHQGQASPYLPATIYVCGSMCTIHQVSHRNYTITIHKVGQGIHKPQQMCSWHHKTTNDSWCGKSHLFCFTVVW